ncbi:MAG: hypothetical protein M3044_05725 [Thermoproteota archaeon]|nr:hypothetical protein [Thermoproteota archaeon]
MLQGHSPQQIRKILDITNIKVYNDLKVLTQSKQYVYDMAKGTHVLMYQKAIEGIGLTLTEAWSKYNDPKIPEKQRLGYLRLTKEYNSELYNLTANGPTVMSIQSAMDNVSTFLRSRIDRIYDSDLEFMRTGVLGR